MCHLSARLSIGHSRHPRILPHYSLDHGYQQSLYEKSPHYKACFCRSGPGLRHQSQSVLLDFRPPYGLADSVESWWRTLRTFLLQNMGLIQCVSNPCLSYLKMEASPVLLSVYIDYLFFAGGEERQVFRQSRIALPYEFCR